jgi:hypothetical protein
MKLLSASGGYEAHHLAWRGLEAVVRGDEANAQTMRLSWQAKGPRPCTCRYSGDKMYS